MFLIICTFIFILCCNSHIGKVRSLDIRNNIINELLDLIFNTVSSRTDYTQTQIIIYTLKLSNYARNTFTIISL